MTAVRAAFVSLIALGGCAGTPPPDWQLNTHNALERAQQAHLTGNARAERAELEFARREVSSTGRIDLRARVELAYCAARVAGLEFEPCAEFEGLRADAPAAERAYADYLAARLDPKDVALLPALHRDVAAAGPQATAAVLERIEDPLARLVAAAVLLRSGRADPPIARVAADTASAQGWRRPLLAWLKIQLKLAEQAGATSEVERLNRRIALVQGEETAAPARR
jgi:hypothetical protein